MVSTDKSFDDVTVLIRNRIASEIPSITDRLGNTITINTVTFAWPSEEKITESQFPFIVIQNEDAEDLEYLYAYEEVSNRISIEAVALKNDEAIKIISKCYDVIKQYKDGLREQGVTKIRLIDKDSENDEIGAFRIRRMRIVIEIRWRRDAW